MERYVTSTQLKQELRLIKSYAEEDVVHVTESGHAAFILCSTEVYERRLSEVRRRARWKAAVDDCLISSALDVASERVAPLADTAPIDPDAHVMVTSSMAEELKGGFDEDGWQLAGRMLSELYAHPSMGLVIEYDPQSLAAQGLGTVRKALVPPCDILYTYDDSTDKLLICGVVPSLDIDEAVSRE